MSQKQNIPLYQRLNALRKNMRPIKTAVVNPIDALTLGGAIQASEAGIIEPLLIGNKHVIEKQALQHSFNIDNIQILHVTGDELTIAEHGVQMVHEGKANAIMKGSLHTDHLIKPIVAKTGLRTARRISHIFVMDVPNYPVPLYLTDAAINIRPTLLEKRDIIQNAIDLFLTLQPTKTENVPKVAIVSATEMINPNIPTTIEAAALCKMADRGQITGGILEGPLGFDNAISDSAAKIKNIKSSLAGSADIIHVPDIESGNIVYKQMSCLSNIASAGIVLGAQVPIILTSRSAGADTTRLASCAIAQIYFNQQNNINHSL